MKKLLYLLPLTVLVAAFAACGNNDTAQEAQEETPAPIVDVVDVPSPTPAQVPEPAPTPTPEAPAPLGMREDPTRVLWETSFEDNHENVAPRGGAAIELTSSEAHTGSYSLLVSGRSADSNGITVDVSEFANPMLPHGFGAWVKPIDQEATFRFSVEFTVQGSSQGRTLWEALPLAPDPAVTFTKTAQPGEWTQLLAYRPFYDFERVVIHVETVGAPEVSFYIDDISIIDANVRYNFDPTLPRLFEVFEDYFIVGTAIEPRDFIGTRFDFIRHHYAAITAGNHMKPDHLQVRPGEFFWETADHIVDTTLANGMQMIGHTLVWHAQSPGFLNPDGIDRDEAIENLVHHVTTVASHFGGRVAVWDVVNEAFPSSVHGDPTDWRSAMRDTPWLRAIGPEYIEIAFRAAHAADPYAILIYNDYNLNQRNKREAVFHMIYEFLENDVPIHGVGMQGHYSTGTSIAEVRASISRFAELGIQIHITELDVTVPDSLGNAQLTPTQELVQALHYAELFHLFKEYSHAVYRVTLWGLDDGTSWRANRFPLIFNSDLSAKESFHALVDTEAILRQFMRIE
ncbi:MAG: endo-1,4-beta-xylanase [Defluviitaleaceae bacterium]|nr:endo-1,4-beta-xylanase [Defluviitaleaceae bacterium]